MEKEEEGSAGGMHTRASALGVERERGRGARSNLDIGPTRSGRCRAASSPGTARCSTAWALICPRQRCGGRRRAARRSGHGSPGQHWMLLGPGHIPAM